MIIDSKHYVTAEFHSHKLMFSKRRDTLKYLSLINDPYFQFIVTEGSYIIPRANYRVILAVEEGKLELQVQMRWQQIGLKILAIPLRDMPESTAVIEFYEMERIIKIVKQTVSEFTIKKN